MNTQEIKIKSYEYPEGRGFSLDTNSAQKRYERFLLTSLYYSVPIHLHPIPREIISPQACSNQNISEVYNCIIDYMIFFGLEKSILDHNFLSIFNQELIEKFKEIISELEGFPSFQAIQNIIQNESQIKVYRRKLFLTKLECFRFLTKWIDSNYMAISRVNNTVVKERTKLIEKLFDAKILNLIYNHKDDDYLNRFFLIITPLLTYQIDYNESYIINTLFVDENFLTESLHNQLKYICDIKLSALKSIPEDYFTKNLHFIKSKIDKCTNNTMRKVCFIFKVTQLYWEMKKKYNLSEHLAWDDQNKIGQFFMKQNWHQIHPLFKRIEFDFLSFFRIPFSPEKFNFNPLELKARENYWKLYWKDHLA